MTTKLPTPTGKYMVGYTDGVFTTGENGERQLGYRCYYPACEASGQPANYYSESGMAEYFCSAHSGHPFAERVKAFEAVPTHSYLDAKPTVETGLKVILYSHSFGALTWNNLIQIEHLVSTGYVVFAVSHTGDTFYTRLGDTVVGLDVDNYRLTMSELIKNMLSKELSQWTKDDISNYIISCTRVSALVERWTDAMRALMNHIEAVNLEPEHLLYGKLDTGVFGAFGGSLGGAVALNTALLDTRIVCAANIDGWQMGASLLSNRLGVPALYITKDARHYEGNYGDHNYNVRCLEIKGSSNMFMTDWCILLEEEVRSIDRPTPALKGSDMAAMLNEILETFFGEYLKSATRSLK